MHICMGYGMDWSSIRFDWNRARAFLVTAEEGSLSAAARVLKMTQPTLSRQVAALEKEFGVALFERVGRGFELTPTGKSLIKHVRIMGDAASDLSLAASSKSQSLEGNVCISATEATAVFMLPPIIQRLRKAEPLITIELIASNKISDLKRREADIAIRAFRPTEPDLFARKVRSFIFNLYAAKAYHTEFGPLQTKADLKHADFVGFDNGHQFLDVLNQNGLDLSRKNFPITAENHSAHWALVKQGMGIGGMIEEIGEAELLVERVLPTLSFPMDDVWLVAHRELKTNKRVRRVFDFLANELS